LSGPVEETVRGFGLKHHSTQKDEDLGPFQVLGYLLSIDIGDFALVVQVVAELNLTFFH